MSFGKGENPKTVSLTLDNTGHPLAAASSVVVNPPRYSEDQGHGGYWTIRLVRRVSPGVWEPVPGPVDGRPEWAAPRQPDQDVLCDWVRVLSDSFGGIHVTWHGTAVSRIYGNDRAYYAWRSPGGVWSDPVQLREPDANRGYGWSYAPSLALDGDRALTLTFYNLSAGNQMRGFDSDLGLFHDGRKGCARHRELPVTRFAERSIVAGEPANALSAWFPAIAPALVSGGGDGRIWADILAGAGTDRGEVTALPLIVWIRRDVTDWLKAAGQ